MPKTLFGVATYKKTEKSTCAKQCSNVYKNSNQAVHGNGFI